MLSTANKKPISVGILQISSQNKAILEYFFSNTGKKSFKEVSLEKASAFIIDYDSPGAKDSWDATFKETHKPGIIISIKEVDLPSCIWLPKPLTVKALMEAGVSIKEMMLQIQEDNTEKLYSATVEPSPLKEKNKTVVKAKPEVIKTVPEELFQFDEIKEDNIKAENFIETSNLLDSELDIDLEAKSEQTVNVALETVDTVVKEPALEVVETTPSASSSNFAMSPNPVEIDNKLNNPKSVSPDSDLDFKPKKSTTSNKKEVIAKDELNESNTEIDLLLESLISGNKKVDDPLTDSPNINNSNTDNIASPDNPDQNIPEITPSLLNKKTHDEIDLTLTDASLTKENNPELLEFETTEVDKKIESTKNNDIDIIDFELEAPVNEPEPINEPVIVDDGSSMILRDQIDDLDANLDLANNSTFSATKVNASINTKDNNQDAADLIPIKENTKKLPKKTAEEELQQLLEEIRQEADNSSDSSSDNSEKTPKHTSAEERWMLTCGKNEDTDDIKTLCTLTPSNHMIATLLETIEKANWSKKVLRLKHKNIIIVIDPATDHIYCDQSIFSESYANICYEPLTKKDILVHELDTSEIRLYRKKMKTNKDKAHSFEAFIWTTSLLTARGRLPVDTDINTNIGLKYWPNLTRVEKTPHMMQIAAIFHQQSCNLQTVANEIGIPQKYVFAFYNAALSLDIIKNGSTSNSSSSVEIDEENNKNKGFFSRLLKRISS